MMSTRDVETEAERGIDRTSIITTSDLRKEFRDLVAVESLDLYIPRGMLYGLIGPNGSGKTTAIKMLVGLLRPTSGTAQVLGEEVPMKRGNSKVGYMPQEQAIYTDLTVLDNLELFADLYGVPKVDFEGRAETLLQMVDLSDRKDDLVGELSGGMKHRTSLACALVHDPEVVFLDEPTVGVDPELRSGFWSYFSDLKGRGKTIVLTTHYMDEAVRCDVVGMMRQGHLIAEGTPEELMRATGASNLEDAFMTYARREGE
jgi:ABC-2 type transport system ATP-binding protein